MWGQLLQVLVLRDVRYVWLVQLILPLDDHCASAVTMEQLLASVGHRRVVFARRVNSLARLPLPVVIPVFPVDFLLETDRPIATHALLEQFRMYLVPCNVIFAILAKLLRHLVRQFVLIVLLVCSVGPQVLLSALRAFLVIFPMSLVPLFVHNVSLEQSVLLNE